LDDLTGNKTVSELVKAAKVRVRLIGLKQIVYRVSYAPDGVP